VSTVDPRDARIAELERMLTLALEQVRTLSARVTELERRLGEGPRGDEPPSAGGSTPARHEPSGRKPGGQPGHKGNKRRMLPPEQVTRTVDCFPKKCRGCGSKLARRRDGAPVLHQVVELPPVVPDVTEFRQHRVTCACGTTTCGELPIGTARGMLGPRLLALASILVASCHVSRRKVQALLRDVLHVDVSLGALSESEQVVADAVEAPVEAARAYAIAAAVKHADGTTWYRKHLFRSLWVLATKAVTVFGIFDSGTADTLLAWMGTTGVLISDRGSQLHFWDTRRRQLCWAHLIRKFAWYAEQPGLAREYGLGLLGYTRALLHEWHRARDGCISRETFIRKVRTTRATIEMLLEAGTRVPEIGGSCAHILAHRDALWYFVSHEGVEPTNNHAERELRGFVLWRKSSLGSQSARGDRFAANLKSVIHTCRKQGRHALDYLTRALQAHLAHRSAPSLIEVAP
jgi:transposase